MLSWRSKLIPQLSKSQNRGEDNLVKALLSILKWTFGGPPDPQIALESDERVIARSRSTRLKGMWGGANTGPLILTDRRLLWRAADVPRIPGDLSVRLDQIVAVRKVGPLANWFLGGAAFKVHLKNHRSIKLYWFEDDDKLDKWIETLWEAIVKVKLEA